MPLDFSVVQRALSFHFQSSSLCGKDDHHRPNLQLLRQSSSFSEVSTVDSVQ